MKTLNDYLSMAYRMEIVEDKDEGGYVVSFPELPKKEWLMAALEDGVEINEPDDIEKYSGQFKLRIPKSLHKSLSEHSKKEGISMNQYCLYLLSKNDVLYSK